MSVKIRMRRMGSKRKPFYRIVVADSRMPRDGRFIEEVGYYNPLTNPDEVKLEEDKIFEWLERNNFHGKFIILDDDISDIIIYKDLAARIVQTSYYKGWGGFGFRHFVKAISLFIKEAIL